jgi:two-component system sensor histidine kinase KdpD
VAERQHDAAKADAAQVDPAELIAVATHELRAPLTALVGFASTLRDGWRDLAPNDLDTCVDAIDRQAQRLAAMVEDLLAASVADAGAGRVELESVDVATVIGVACTDAQVERSHELIVKLPADVPAVWADAHALQRVIVNLLTNAARYSPRGSRIEVSATATASHVSVAVQDHGRGIDPAVREHLFDKFGRGAGGPRSSSGIGLYVVRKLTDLMGATVDVDNGAGGEGARFTITLARAERTLRAVPAPAAAIAAA